MEDGTYKGIFTNRALTKVEKISPWGVKDVTKTLSDDEIDLLEGVFLLSILKNDGSMSHILVKDGVPSLMKI